MNSKCHLKKGRLRLLGCGLLCTFLVGCDSVKSTLGLDHYRADEFVVPENPPLTVPANFNVRPPCDINAPVKKEPPQAKELLLGKAILDTAKN